MVMKRRFTRRRRVSSRSKPDLMTFSFCRQPIVMDSINDCNTPAQDWSFLTGPQVSNVAPAPGTSNAATRGLSFLGCRFRYAIGIAQLNENPTEQYVVTVRSFIVVHPCDDTGAPLTTAGLLPVLGSFAGPLKDPGATQILWSGLNQIAVNPVFTALTGFQNTNDLMRYNPLERVKTKRFLREGQALYWVTEAVAGGGDDTTLGLDLLGVMALKSRF